MIENLVIGSGPVGIAAAWKVTLLGSSCTLIDAGEEIELHKQKLVEALAAKNFSEWNRGDKETYQNLTKSESRLKTHVGSKLLFGSSFPYAEYRSLGDYKVSVNSQVNIYPSLASGGLANVWGSICLPYAQSDAQHLRVKPRQEDYDFIDDFMPIAARRDGLSKIYSMPSQTQDPVSASNFGNRLRSKFPLIEKSLPFNVYGGSPRVAVYTKGSNKCQSCGLCATGCVWGSIWDAKREILELKKNENFSYFKGFRVNEIIKHNGHYEVKGFDGAVILARRIFLAAGPIGTTIILQKSELIPKQIFFSDTQLTIVPCLIFGKRQTDNNFVLSQYLLNFPSEKDEGGTDCFVQITGYNPDLTRRIRGYFSFTKYVPKFILEVFFRYLGIAMIFQNSNSSGQVRITSENGTINVSTVTNSEENILHLGVFKNIRRVLKKLNMLPLTLLSQVVGVGESYHIGKMTSCEGKLILNSIGEISGIDKLHVIDTCALDHIAPGPITYTAMANAVRIVEDVIKK